MHDDGTKMPVESRRAQRIDLDGRVTIRLAAGAIVGSGQNLSEQGVFFVAEGSVPVEVEIEGREGTFTGELVRIENLGDGGVGIAVRFDGRHVGLIDG